MDALIAVLVAAIVQVESGGDPNALGDYRNGKPMAVGILQLWPIYVHDVNRIARDNGIRDRFDPTARRDPNASKTMVRIYLKHYGRDYERRTGKKATQEVLARLHNSGPYDPQPGREWPIKSDEYWAKVRAALEAQEKRP